jgi:hypothetical protein
VDTRQSVTYICNALPCIHAQYLQINRDYFPVFVRDRKFVFCEELIESYSYVPEGV